uniref:Replicase n=1 Tax=Barley aphid RNA virus 4 TaxID=2703493 RepID=A0A6F8QH68_9VIRU|nr:replicase [Barley aphid RNA virus 4]
MAYHKAMDKVNVNGMLQDNDKLNFICSRVGADVDELMAQVFRTAVTDPTSVHGVAIRNMCMNKLEKDAEKYSRAALANVGISQALKQDDQELLKTLYPEYTIYFTNKSRETHGFAHASRILETSLVMQRLHYYSSTKQKPYSVYLKDVGGSRIHHGLKGNCAVHVCAPILNQEDEIRRLKADAKLKSVSSSGYRNDNVARSVMAMTSIGKHYCNNKSQNCDVKANALMFIHSIYDMTMLDVANSMSAANATIAAGSFIFDPLIVMLNKGVLHKLNVTWEKFTVNNVWHIKFSFLNDSQPAYVHSYKNYLALINTVYFSNAKKTRHYAFRLEDNRAGIQFFSIYQLSHHKIPASTTIIDRHTFSANDYYRVTYYTMIEDFSIDTKLKKINLYVPTILWDQVYDSLYQQTEGSFTMSRAHELVMSYNRKTIICGQTVSHNVKIPSYAVDKVASALYVRVYIDKYLSSKTLTFILSDIDRVRKMSNTGLLKYLWYTLKEKFSELFVTHDLKSQETIVPYAAWDELSKLYKLPVDVTSAVTATTISTQIPEIIQAQLDTSLFSDVDYIQEQEIPITPITRTPSVSSISGSSTSLTSTTGSDYASICSEPAPSPIRDYVYQHYDSIPGVVQSVPGDGDCLFHAVMALMRYHDIECPSSPHDMRLALANDVQTNKSKYFGDINDLVSYTEFMSDLTTDNRPTDMTTLNALAIFYGFTAELYYDTNIQSLKNKKMVYDNNGPTIAVKFTIESGSIGHFEPIIHDELISDKKDDLMVMLNETQKSIDDFIEMTRDDETLQQRFHVTLKLGDEYDVSRSLIHIMNEFNVCSFPALMITNKTNSVCAFDSIEGPLNLVSDKIITTKRTNTSTSAIQLDKISDYICNICDAHKMVIVDVASYDYNDDDNTIQIILDVMDTMVVDDSDLIVRFNITPTKKFVCELATIMSWFSKSAITYGISEGTTTPTRYLVCYGLKKRPLHIDSEDYTKILASVEHQLIRQEYYGFSVHMDALSVLYDNKEINYVTDFDYESCFNMSQKILKGGSLRDLRNSIKLIVSIYKNVNAFETGTAVAKCNDILPDIIRKFKIDVQNTCASFMQFVTKMKFSKNKVKKIQEIFSNKITDIQPITTNYVDLMCVCKKKSYCPNIDGLYVASCDCDVVIVLITNGYVVKFVRDSYYVKNAIRNTIVKRMYRTATEVKQKYIAEIAHRSFQFTYDMQIIDNFNLNREIDIQIIESLKKKISSATVNDVKHNDENVNCDRPAHVYCPINDKVQLSDAINSAVKMSSIEPTPDIEHRIFSKDPQVNSLKNSFIEISNIWLRTQTYHETELKLVYNTALKTCDVDKVSKWLYTRPDNVHVNYYGKWLPDKPTIDYMFVYACDGFKKKICANKDELYVVADYTEKKFEPVFLQKTKNILDTIDKISLKTKFHFISGVPGCGKTTYIMKHHSDNDLVLSATKAGAIEFRQRAAEKKKPNVKNRYRTVYSYVYNETTEFDTIWIDEAMMLHPGMIFAIAVLSKCKNMHMIGDPKQIPYYTRIDYPSRYHIFSNIFPIDKELSTSYRCPKDVADYMKRYYNKFTSESKIIKSLNRLYVSGVSEVPVSYDAYLTFTQSDKQLLLGLFNNVYTIHEYQGKQDKNICLFRGSPTPITTYDSIEHHIVGLTRHTHSFVYATVVMDKLYESIDELRGGGNNIDYTATNIMTNIKSYDVLYFDTGKTNALHLDIKNYIVKLSNSASSKVHNDLIGDNYILHTYKQRSGKMLYHATIHNVNNNKKLLKSLKLITNNVYDSPFHKSNDFIHIINSFDKILDWRLFTSNISHSLKYMVHDLNNTLNKYRLVDVIKKNHDLYFCDRIYDDVHNDDATDIKPPGILPDVCVLIYTDMNYDFGTTSRFKFVDYTVGSISSIHEGKKYCNVAILSKHLVKQLNKTNDGTSIKNFKSINALINYYQYDECYDDVRVLQSFIDTMLPNAVDIKTDYDVAMVAHSDFSVHLQFASFDSSMIHYPIKFFDSVKPVLSTAMSPPRPTNSLKELTKAIEKRNCAVPKIQVTMDVWAKAKELFNKLTRLVYDDTIHDDISFTELDLQDWIDTQDSNIINLVKNVHYNDLKVNSYNLTIKKNSKPALDMSAVNTYASLQTVVFTPKDFNTLFCPMFKIMKKRMIDTMNDKFIMYTDMPPSKFSELLTKKFSTYILKEYHSLEFDVSKYDKSQNLLHLLVDCMIMRHFGIPECFVTMWFNGHCDTKLYDPGNRFYCDVYFQRKSGDPSTWLLNTQQILTMIVNCIPEPAWAQIILVVASGDDSEIFSTGKLQICTSRFSNVFNYEVKVYDKYTSMYFCSKFLIITEYGTYMLPDIYKLIKKLGRHDLKSRDHVLSFRNSVLDSLKDFSVPHDIMIQYEKSMYDRYKFPGTISINTVYQSLCKLTYDSTAFENLYIPNPDYYSNKYGKLSDL